MINSARCIGRSCGWKYVFVRYDLAGELGRVHLYPLKWQIIWSLHTAEMKHPSFIELLWHVTVKVEGFYISYYVCIWTMCKIKFSKLCKNTASFAIFYYVSLCTTGRHCILISLKKVLFIFVGVRKLVKTLTWKMKLV